MVLEISNNLFERFNEVDEVDDGLMSERNSHPGHKIILHKNIHNLMFL